MCTCTYGTYSKKKKIFFLRFLRTSVYLVICYTHNCSNIIYLIYIYKKHFYLFIFFLSLDMFVFILLNAFFFFYYFFIFFIYLYISFNVCSQLHRERALKIRKWSQFPTGFWLSHRRHVHNYMTYFLLTYTHFFYFFSWTFIFKKYSYFIFIIYIHGMWYKKGNIKVSSKYKSVNFYFYFSLFF